MTDSRPGSGGAHRAGARRDGPTSVSFVELDGEGRIVRACPGLAELLARPSDSLISSRLEDYVAEPSRPLLDEALAGLWAGETVAGLTVRLERADGSIAPARAYGSALELARGGSSACLLFHPLATSGASLDLARDPDLLELVLECAELGLWDQRFDEGIVLRDARWAEMLGYAPGEVGTDFEFWHRSIHPDDAPHVRRLATEHEAGRSAVFKAEHRLRAKDGGWRWVRNWGRIVERDGEGRPLRAVGTHLDISEEKNAEESRRQLESQIREAQRVQSLRALAGGVAHDFNNLLQAVLGNLDLALADLGAKDAVREQVAAASEAASRAALLTQQMLAYSGRGAFVKEFVDLARVAETLRLELEERLPPGVRLELDLATEAGSVDADPGQMRQLVNNLVANACDALDGISGTIVVRVQPGQRLNGEPSNIVLEVQDSGCGMSPEVLDRAFDPYFTTKTGGAGLGLSAVWGIAVAHGGSASIESAKGRGCTVRVTLPVHAAEIDLPEPRTELRKEADLEPLRLTVLFVDDEPSVRLVGKRMLEELGHEVVLAEDGAVALQIYEERGREIDVVILDLKMPRMDGQQALAAIRGLDPEARVVISSGYNQREAIELLGQGRAVPFLHKPYRIKTIEKLLRELFSD